MLTQLDAVFLLPVCVSQSNIWPQEKTGFTYGVLLHTPCHIPEKSSKNAIRLFPAFVGLFSAFKGA